MDGGERHALKAASVRLRIRPAGSDGGQLDVDDLRADGRRWRFPSPWCHAGTLQENDFVVWREPSSRPAATPVAERRSSPDGPAALSVQSQLESPAADPEREADAPVEHEECAPGEERSPAEDPRTVGVRPDPPIDAAAEEADGGVQEK